MPSKHAAHYAKLIPGGAEIWYNSDNRAWYVVYQVPTRPGVWMAYWIEDPARLSEILPPGTPHIPSNADRVFNNDWARRGGFLEMGWSRQLAENTPHPFTRLVADYERNAQLQPWLRDPEVMAAVVDATLEGREFTAADLQRTNWWRTRTEAERSWAALTAQDPSTAARRIQDARGITRQAMIEAGIANPSDLLVSTLADNLTTGRWTEEYWRTQIRYLADPYSRPRPDSLDPELAKVIQAVGQPDQTQKGVDKVRQAISRNLGPAFAGGWKENHVQYWAGQLRNDPDAEQRLNETLRSQFQALFPAYKDNPDADYETVAAPWRSFVNQVWGQDPDETDPLFLKVIAMNDAQAAGEVLRKEGLTRGVGKVATDLTTSLAEQFGFGVIPTGR